MGGAIQRTPLEYDFAWMERTDFSSGPSRMAEAAPSEPVSDSHGEFIKIYTLVNRSSIRKFIVVDELVLVSDGLREHKKVYW